MLDVVEPEWPSGLQCRACGTDGHGFEPQTSTNACGHVCRYMDRKGSAAMLTSIQSVGVAPEVNLRNSLHAGDKAHKQGIHPGFETQGRRHQKSKTGVSVASRKGQMSSKNFLKNFKKKNLCSMPRNFQTTKHSDVNGVQKLVAIYVYKNRVPTPVKKIFQEYNCCSSILVRHFKVSYITIA